MSHTPTIVDHARVTIMTFYLPSIPSSLQTLGRCECVATRALAPLGLRIISPLTFYLKVMYILEFKRTSDQRQDYRERGECHRKLVY